MPPLEPLSPQLARTVMELAKAVPESERSEKHVGGGFTYSTEKPITVEALGIVAHERDALYRTAAVQLAGEFPDPAKDTINFGVVRAALSPEDYDHYLGVIRPRKTGPER